MSVSESLRPHLDRIQRMSLILGAIGLAGCAGGYFVDHTQLLRSYLWAYIFWCGISLGSLGALLLHNTVGGKWGVVIHNLAETACSPKMFVVFFILLIPILLNIGILYPWAFPEAAKDPVIQHKVGYLNVPFFVGRAVLYFAIWILYGAILGRVSKRIDETGDEALVIKTRQISAPGLVVVTFACTFAFFDWVMSLEPHWYSTIYGLMFLIGMVLAAFCFIISMLVLAWANDRTVAEYVTPQHFHDLGNMVFAFTNLWAYLSVSQFIIIWSGNLPDEIPWYLRRFHGGWGWVAVFLCVFHFAVPFVLLLHRGVKRNARVLVMVCVGLFAVRMLNEYWLVEPGFFGQGMHFSWMDIATGLFFGGLWVYLFMAQIKQKSILPMNDPRLAEAPQETVAA